MTGIVIDGPYKLQTFRIWANTAPSFTLFSGWSTVELEDESGHVAWRDLPVRFLQFDLDERENV